MGRSNPPRNAIRPSAFTESTFRASAHDRVVHRIARFAVLVASLLLHDFKLFSRPAQDLPGSVMVLRPNERASAEKAPGPPSISAARADRWQSNIAVLSPTGGSHSVMNMPVRAAARVRRPRSRARANSPVSQEWIAAAGSGSRASEAALEKRISKRPAPRVPAGYSGKNDRMAERYERGGRQDTSRYWVSQT